MQTISHFVRIENFNKYLDQGDNTSSSNNLQKLTRDVAYIALKVEPELQNLIKKGYTLEEIKLAAK